MTESQTVTSTDVATIRRATVDVSMIQELEDALLSGAVPAEVEQDPEQVQRELIRKLLEAESDEQLERLEAEPWGDYEGVPFEVLDFVWRPSSFDEGQPVFLVVRAISLADGTPHVLTTGSAQAMAQLANLAKRGSLPAIRELASAETKSKRTVYWLKTPDAIAEERRAAAMAARTAASASSSDGDDAK